MVLSVIPSTSVLMYVQKKMEDREKEIDLLKVDDLFCHLYCF